MCAQNLRTYLDGSSKLYTKGYTMSGDGKPELSHAPVRNFSARGEILEVLDILGLFLRQIGCLGWVRPPFWVSIAGFSLKRSLETEFGTFAHPTPPSPGKHYFGVQPPTNGKWHLRTPETPDVVVGGGDELTNFGYGAPGELSPVSA